MSHSRQCSFQWSHGQAARADVPDRKWVQVPGICLWPLCILQCERRLAVDFALLGVAHYVGSTEATHRSQDLHPGSARHCSPGCLLTRSTTLLHCSGTHQQYSNTCDERSCSDYLKTDAALYNWIRGRTGRMQITSTCQNIQS